jgi:hypothetical protein
MFFSQQEAQFLINLFNNLTIKPAQPDAGQIVEYVKAIADKIIIDQNAIETTAPLAESQNAIQENTPS